MDNLKNITNVIKNTSQEFEQRLKHLIDNADNCFREDLSGFIFSNPKRLRPLFVFLFANILKITNSNVMEIALASELIHTASLMHDDIIDEEKIRRNNPTFYSKFGTKIAILEGDYLLSSALSVLSRTSLEIIKIFSKKIEKTISGELEQNKYLNKITDETLYLERTFNKTANLFLAGLESLFTLKKIDDEIKKCLDGFLKNFCMAFQIKNDIDNIKFNKASDIKNGNNTLVMIYFVMDNPIEEFNNQNLDKYIEKANKKVLDYKSKAFSYLEKIETSSYKIALKELTEAALRS